MSTHCDTCGRVLALCLCNVAPLPDEAAADPEQRAYWMGACDVCGSPRHSCSCGAEADASEEEQISAELRPLQPPAKLRWIADDMDRAFSQAQLGQATSLARVRVWAGTLQAMHRGLMQSVEAGGGGVGGNRRQRRANLKRVK